MNWNWREFWKDLKVTLWYGFVGAIILVIVVCLLGLLLWVVNQAQAAGVTAHNPAKPHLSLAAAGGGGGGAPVMLSPSPTAGHELDWVSLLLKYLRMGFASKNWLLFITALGVGILQLVKMFAAPYIAFLRTDRGGVALALVGGTLTSILDSAVRHNLSIDTVIQAVYYGVLYAGGYASVKKIIWPTPADRAQLAVAAGEVAGQRAESAASQGAQAAADGINALIGLPSSTSTTLPTHTPPTDTTRK